MTVGCKDCGYNKHDVALDFDHIDPSLKSFSIGRELTRNSIKNIMNEIRKCVVRCSNCHRIKSYLEGRNEFVKEY